MDARVRELSASLVTFGFDGSSREAPDHARRMIERGCVSAILFGRNVDSPDQVKSLCTSLKEEAQARGRKLLVMTDQEGGRVARLRGSQNFTEIPSARRIASCDESVAAITRIAKVIAAELKAVKIDMDLAPVLDVDSNPRNPVIGDRSYSSSARKVGELGKAFISAMQAEGVATCAKHFPGHGDTHQDSHEVLPTIAHGLDRLEAVEIAPFREAVSAGVPSILVGHLLVPSLQSAEDAELGIPASMSATIAGFVRDALGFRGVLLVDDMEMGAVTANFTVGEAIVRALKGGVDLFLVCHSEAVQAEAIEAIAAAVERGEVPRARLEEAAERVRRLVNQYASGAYDTSIRLVGSPAHREIVKSILAKCNQDVL